VFAGRSVFGIQLGPAVCLVQWLPIAGRLKPAANPPECGHDALQHIHMIRDGSETFDMALRAPAPDRINDPGQVRSDAMQV
jgi:hypothetical protein